MKLIVIAAAIAASTPGPAAPAESQSRAPAPTERRGMHLQVAPPTALREMPNAFDQRPGCTPVIRQVQDQERRSREGDTRTLDREPPANLLLAVDREVDGCREVTFVRRNIAPGTPVSEEPGRQGSTSAYATR